MDWIKGKLKGKNKRGKKPSASASTTSLPGLLGSPQTEPFLRPAKSHAGRLSDCGPYNYHVEDPPQTTTDQTPVVIDSQIDVGQSSGMNATLSKKTENPTIEHTKISQKRAGALKAANDVFRSSLRLASTILQADPTQIGKAVVDTVSFMMDELEVCITLFIDLRTLTCCCLL